MSGEELRPVSPEAPAGGSKHGIKLRHSWLCVLQHLRGACREPTTPPCYIMRHMIPPRTNPKAQHELMFTRTWCVFHRDFLFSASYGALRVNTEVNERIWDNNTTRSLWKTKKSAPFSLLSYRCSMPDHDEFLLWAPRGGSPSVKIYEHKLHFTHVFTPHC